MNCRAGRNTSREAKCRKSDDIAENSINECNMTTRFASRHAKATVIRTHRKRKGYY